MLIAYSSRWEYYNVDGAVYYSAPGGDLKVWCDLNDLRRHLYRLRQIRGYRSLVPPEWAIVDKEFFKQLGIK